MRGRVVIATADFFTPVVDDAYDWGRIAAANALSDIYAMGGEPLLAINLLAWPRDKIPFELAASVLRGGADTCLEAGTHLAGGHSIDDPEPKYGLAVTGFGNADTLLRNDAAAVLQALQSLAARFESTTRISGAGGCCADAAEGASTEAAKAAEIKRYFIRIGFLR